VRRSLVVITALFAALTLGAGLVAGCGSSSSKSSTTVAVDYSKPGPYPVGTTSFMMDDRIVFMFYPADEDRLDEGTPVTSYSSASAFPPALRAAIPAELTQEVPLDATKDAPIATDGPFPVLIHSHGFGGYPEFTSQHLAHLATWGFVSAAPDHLERNLAANSLGKVVRGETDVEDLRNTLKHLQADNESGPFAGSMNFDQVAAEGHSAGGAAAGKFAYDPAVKTFIGQAPGAPLKMNYEGTNTADQIAAAYAAQTPPDKPSMLLAGEVDQTIPLASIAREYDWLVAPKRFLVLKGAGHNAFTDICKPIREGGGLMQYSGRLPAPDNLLRLGEDGCTPENLDIDTGYGLINHMTVAQLRHVFGIDSTEASLTPSYVESLFPDAIARYDVEN
jgi:pimeloyl-ACP methyl ester carboxylesterase